MHNPQLERIGEILTLKNLSQKGTGCPSQNIVKKIAKTMKNNARGVAHYKNMLLGNMCRSRVISSFPRRPQTSTNFFRTTGSLEFELLASQRTGLPFGVSPRRILAYIDTQILKNTLDGKNRIYLGNTRRETALMFGFPGSTAAVDEFYKNLTVLKNTFIIIRPIAQNSKTSKMTPIGLQDHENVRIIARGNDHYMAKNSTKTTGVTPLKQCWIEVSQEYIEHVKKDPIPIDVGYYSSLKSPLDMDLYAYFNHRLYPVDRFNKEVIVSKNVLMDELGPVLAPNLTAKQRTSEKRNFIRAVNLFLKKAKETGTPFHNFDFEQTHTAFILISGETHVLDRREKQQWQKLIEAKQSNASGAGSGEND